MQINPTNLLHKVHRIIQGARGGEILKYRHERWRNLDPLEKEKYRDLNNDRIEKSRKSFIENHLSVGEFEDKYDSDFDKVIAHVDQLFKVQ